MTLAVTFLCSFLFIVPASALGTLSARVYAQNPSLNNGAAAQEQEPAKLQIQSADTKPAQSTSNQQGDDGQKKPAAKKLVHHKKKPKQGCATDPNAASAPNTGTGASGQISSNCQPPKIVVRQGGTSEPSIQLAGGDATGQASQQKNNANQMLGTTEENLKKLSGRQLNATEQDMVTQIRQYMEQAKTAVAAGDPDRARTLAWKAQTLSEDLTKPKE